jgi:predicted ATPase
LKSTPDGEPAAFPFSVPAIRELERLHFSAPVTFFVGANGSGKSTLLEGIAAAAALPTVGSTSVQSDPTLAAQRRLARALQLVWNRRTHRGFFLRAEDFFGFAKQINQLRSDLQDRLGEVAVEYADRSAYARGLAEGPARASLGELEGSYGKDADAASHGERFLRLLDARVVPGGLYLLDEPEAALSPQSQLALISLFARMLREGSQLIVATHSPILMAFPNATIFGFDSVPPQEVSFEELEHVNLTRDFLNNPQQYLRHLV